MNLQKKMSINLDLSFTNLSYKKTFETELCMKTKFSAEINYKLIHNFDAFAGLSYNVLASDKVADSGLQKYAEDITKTNIQTTTFKSVKLQYWPGVSVGLKYNI